jgi:hypothetical protein
MWFQLLAPSCDCSSAWFLWLQLWHRWLDSLSPYFFFSIWGAMRALIRAGDRLAKPGQETFSHSFHGQCAKSYDFSGSCPHNMISRSAVHVIAAWGEGLCQKGNFTHT